MAIIFSLNSEHMKIYPIYLTTTGTYYHETVRNRPKGLGEYQFLLTVEGEGLLEFKHKKIIIKPGSLLFIPPNLDHKYQKISNNWITHWITFNGNNLDRLFKTIYPKSIEILKVDINDEIYHQMLDINRLTYSDYQHNALKISSIIYRIIADFRESIDKKHESRSHATCLDRTLSYFKEQYQNNITIDELSQISGISPQYLCRIFKKKMGIRPFEYLKQFRINRAKSLMLENPYKLIEEISVMVGFNNPSYFGSIFKELEGMTPKEFIKLHSKRTTPI